MENVDFMNDFKSTGDVFHFNKHDASDFGYVISESQRLFHSHFTNF